MRLNACELELDIVSRGIQLPLGSRLAADILEVAIPAAPLPKREIFLEVPVVSPTGSSPYHLEDQPAGGHVIVDDRDHERYAVRLFTAPPWYRWLTSRDRPMGQIGALQGPHLHVRMKSGSRVEDVVETCWAAKNESDVRFVELSADPGESRRLVSCVAAIKRDVGMLVGAHLDDDADRTLCDGLIAAGVDHLSFPAGGDVQAMRHCAGRLPPGAVTADLVAGPLLDILETIDRVAAAGALPTLRITGPATAVSGARPLPTLPELRLVMLHIYDACRRYRLPIGAAPSGDSSVVDPDDAALLASRGAGFYWYEGFRLWRRVAAIPALWKRMRSA